MMPSGSHCGDQGFVRYELEKMVARGLLHELWGLRSAQSAAIWNSSPSGPQKLKMRINRVT
jgi:hypothetical protein